MFTTTAFTFGGSSQDVFTKVDVDTSGNMYATGTSYSSGFTSANKDVVIFKFDTTLALTWGRYWGSTDDEVSSGISLDTTAFDSFYVSGYSSSAPTLSTSDWDMFVLKFGIDGTLKWSVRLGGATVDKANTIFYYSNYVYIGGESDSTGWSSANTDMIFARLKSSDGSLDYIKRLGGSQEDRVTNLKVSSDGFVYALGQGFS